MEKVSMYSLSTCPWCRKAKRYFEERGIAYEYADYDRADEERKQRIYKDMSDIGAGGFPVVKIGTNVVVGYKPDRYEELLYPKRI